MSEMTFCARCRLGGDSHETKDECILALRKGMVAQKKASESLAFDLSTRYLSILEELSLRPDIGISYVMWVDGETREMIEPRRVAGVFSAILKEFRERGDWSPMQDLRNRLAMLNARAAEAVREFRDDYPVNDSCYGALEEAARRLEDL